MRRRTSDAIGERCCVSLRPTEALRDMLLASAKKSGRSLAAECEERLAASFEPSGSAGGGVTRQELRFELRSELRLMAAALSAALD